MRVISQEGTIDIPYDSVIIQRFGREIYFLNKNLIGVEKLVSDMDIATYSTKEKAIKAMEMLREQYGKLEVMKVLASGTAEYMEKALATDVMIKHYNTYCDMNVFQFPQDDGNLVVRLGGDQETVNTAKQLVIIIDGEEIKHDIMVVLAA